MEAPVTWLGIATFAVAAVALVVSVTTLWVTHLRRGTIRMTRPSQFYFGADGTELHPAGPPKVYFRALLYSTSRRGRVLENMWITLRRGETTQTFNIWVYGEKELQRGAGLFVGDSGLVTSHHFLLPANETFDFIPGEYHMRVFAQITGDCHPIELATQTLALSPGDCAGFSKGSGGVYFDRSVTSQGYVTKTHAPLNDWLNSMKAEQMGRPQQTP